MNSYENSTLPRLFEILEERKITAKQVSEATGIAASSITAWRTGSRKPKYEAIQAISAFLNIPVEYLTGSDEDPNALDLEIKAKMQQLSDEQKQDVLKYIDFVKQK